MEYIVTISLHRVNKQIKISFPIFLHGFLINGRNDGML
jgi:hypothetical protein